MPLTLLPRECAPFLDFVHALRRQGFAVSPDQTETFLSAITLLGPRGMEHIRHAAIATLAPPIERMGAFEALFRAIFFGEVRAAALQDSTEDETTVNDREGHEPQGEVALEQEQGGAKASAFERLSTRDFDQTDIGLGAFRRALADALPRRHSFRQLRVHSNGAIDLRRSLRDIVRAEGDLAVPRLRRRQEVVRRPLIFIDISGSMSGHTDELLALAHATIQAIPRTEIFTIGTRLSRITTALRAQDRTVALARAATAVDDWNGGTRIGPALKAFLAIPRFAAMARGALVVIASDGLERGGHAEFESSMRRLSHLAHRLSLATPLAGDSRFRPETAALAAVLPWLDDLVDGSSAHAIARFMLTLDRPAPRASAVWKEKAHAFSH
ncbi:VWA domain-containing protein [Rhizobium sp. TH2]|uniref:vWA domain-containing protein n=1 Tax=Rhizobium sp. TH2 TaxID=2775403 RepID=UPI002158612C|nr:VWA domain-containing protein [Rhizobium sp. TH2]UVC11633.1 VWA domain-containing protein [Rhizobium sp. TH2]